MQEVTGSNPVTPTNTALPIQRWRRSKRRPRLDRVPHRTENRASIQRGFRSFVWSLAAYKRHGIANTTEPRTTSFQYFSTGYRSKLIEPEAIPAVTDSDFVTHEVNQRGYPVTRVTDVTLPDIGRPPNSSVGWFALSHSLTNVVVQSSQHRGNTKPTSISLHIMRLGRHSIADSILQKIRRITHYGNAGCRHPRQGNRGRWRDRGVKRVNRSKRGRPIMDFFSFAW